MTFRELIATEVGTQWDNPYYPLLCQNCPLQNTQYCGYEKVLAGQYPVCYYMESEDKLDTTIEEYIRTMQEGELQRLRKYIEKTTELIDWSPYYLPLCEESVELAKARVKELEDILGINKENEDEQDISPIRF